ncbi:metal-dependent hydrolase [Candidatus Woesearchaeota archaeon]|nr:metal-dependent hydrolase [Candidatus Woesearchaeota archaeon]
MLFLTHLLAGIVSVVYLGSMFGIGSNSGKILAVTAAGFFSLLPDIDTVKSRLGRKVEPFSTVFAFFFRHRGFLHTIAAAVIAYFGVRYAVSAAIAAAATIGYASHLLLDALTEKGIRPFSPFFKFRLRGFIRTGSMFEQAVLAALALLLLLKLGFG